MHNRLHCVLAGAALLMPVAITLAAGSVLPGDRGRPMEGVMPAAASARPAAATPQREPPSVVPAPSIELALKAALAIADACKQYPLGIAVVDAEGVAKLIYVPDRSETWHGYSAVRKAYTAMTFKVPTSQLVNKVREDAQLVAKIKADPNLPAFPGGLPLMVGDKVIGAIGVSGAEPGGHDEECGLVGLEKIRNDLK
jgi:uncharacterized protein GlcG (DUF336 family)